MAQDRNPPLNGEIAFDTKEGGRLTMKMGTLAMVQVEDRLDLSIMEIGDLLSSGKVRMGHALALFHASLIHQDSAITEARAAELMDELGPGKALELVGKAFEAAWPQDGDVEREPSQGGAADPPKPGRAGKTKT
jgi:hypothetical protein